MSRRTWHGAVCVPDGYPILSILRRRSKKSKPLHKNVLRLLEAFEPCLHWTELTIRSQLFYIDNQLAELKRGSYSCNTCGQKFNLNTTDLECEAWILAYQRGMLDFGGASSFIVQYKTHIRCVNFIFGRYVVHKGMRGVSVVSQKGKTLPEWAVASLTIPARCIIRNSVQPWLGSISALAHVVVSYLSVRDLIISDGDIRTQPEYKTTAINPKITESMREIVIAVCSGVLSLHQAASVTNTYFAASLHETASFRNRLAEGDSAALEEAETARLTLIKMIRSRIDYAINERKETYEERHKAILKLSFTS